MRQQRCAPFILTLLACLMGNVNLAAMSVSLAPSVASPAPLGTRITWTPTVSGADSGTLSFLFRVRPSNGAFHIVEDYGPKTSLDWTTIQQEGVYEMDVLVRNTETKEVATGSALFTFSPIATSSIPVVTPTANPLVFIYSAAVCASGSRMRVSFQASDGYVQNTPWQVCHSGHAMNFYLAGLRASTGYTANHTIDSGADITTSETVSLTTPAINLEAPPVTVLKPAAPGVNGILLQTIFSTNAIATDLAGNVVWYSPSDITYLTRPQTGGTFIAIIEDGSLDQYNQFVREFDLAGIIQAETNAGRINEQLAPMGVHPINGFHHEARKLPDGSYLVLADSERILTDVQGPGAVDVIGDTILVLNSNLQVEWAWDAFDHLDPHRQALLGETCTPGPGLACAPFYLANVANDWLHGNSLQLTPDGNILYSARHQDWLIKIDYQSGMGAGDVLWKLGNEGDFRIVSNDPSPWFSHQHDANFEANNATLTVFDDGNTRTLVDSAENSRGQALVLDEQKRVAKLILNADLGTYSPAVGSAQKLPNGDYHFDSGFFLDPDGSGNRFSQSVEVNSAGQMVYGIQFDTIEYRTFRMRDLYTAP